MPDAALDREMLARITLGLCLLCSIPARAAPPTVIESRSEPRWRLIVQPECEQFVPPSSADHPLYWDRWLSLASCIQDTSRRRIDHPFDVPILVADLSLSLMPAMLMWRDTIGRAPPKVQLVAAYHVGLAAVALMTRARASLVAGPWLSEAAALERERVLRDRLEPLLVPTNKVAWIAFSVIANHAAEDPDFETDPVNRSMIVSSRQMLQVLERPQLETKDQLTAGLK